ncbi:hypothetical protein PIB30_051559 [Stylosanthes scabra]|uniref:Retrotransposon gag domain-containing protein n=1 Tax=Stylosanthes scabra TaxID=79078 RepID=A0ABU6ZGN9_9FABA|nr:hypothetical protein [Stylosanthes scabra]
MDFIRENTSVLTLLAEVLCLLDMIVNSFAHMISTKPVDRYTRPEFTENGPMAIDSGRHPILENIHNDFVVCSISSFNELADFFVNNFVASNINVHDSNYLSTIKQGQHESLKDYMMRFAKAAMEIPNLNPEVHLHALKNRLCPEEF